MAAANEKRPSRFQAFLNGVERAGNKLPHPFTLFIIITVIVLALAHLMRGFTVEIPGTGNTATVRTILDSEGIRWFIVNLLDNFIRFPPFRAVIITMLGVAVAEQAGLFEAMAKKFLLRMPLSLLTGAVILVGLMSNLASDAGIVFMPALAAVIFLAVGKNPLVGIAAGYASAASGYFANLLITSHDATLTGITAAVLDIVPMTMGAPVHIAVNWYMAIASAIVLVPVGVWVTNRFVEPRFASESVESYKDESINTDVSADESKGLIAAGIALLIYLAILGAISIPEGSILRDPDTGASLLARFDPVIPVIALAFFIPGVAYGAFAKTITSDKDVISFMGEGMKSLSGFLVIGFAASQLIAIFSRTNLATIMAISGSDLITRMGIANVPLIVIFIAFLAFLNLFLYSGTSKWALLAPVFVPMFGILGFSPAFTLAVYRIADSSTNAISPLFPYLPIVLGLVIKYKKDAGIGTVMSMMLPYSIAFLILWTLLAVVWYLLGIPVGPGAPILL